MDGGRIMAQIQHEEALTPDLPQVGGWTDAGVLKLLALLTGPNGNLLP